MNINWFGMVALSVTGLLFVGLTWLRNKNLDFSVLVLAGLALGIITGIFFRGNLEYVSPIASVYVRIITAIVAPLIIVSILAGVTDLGDLKKLRNIGVRSVGWLMFSTLASIIVTLFLSLLMGVGKNAELLLENADIASVEGLYGRLVSFIDVIIDFFPSNIVGDIAENNIVPIILFTGLIAVSYILVYSRDPMKALPFKHFIGAARDIVYQAVGFVVDLTPYAILVLVARAVSRASNAAASILPLLTLLVIAFLLCAIHTYLFNGALLFFAAKLPPMKFFGKIANAQATAFTTQSSVGTLPVTISNLTKKVGVSEEVANFTAPLGTTVGMPGCSGIWPILLAVFAVNALQIPYSAGQYALLCVISLAVSLGTAGVPGTATITSTTVFVAAGLPVEIIVLLLPISTIADMARTATNVTSAAVTAAIVAKKEGHLDLDVFYGRGLGPKDGEAVKEGA